MLRKYLLFTLLAGTAALAWSGNAAAQTATVKIGPSYAYDGADGLASVSLGITPAGINNDTSYSGTAGSYAGTFAGSAAIFWCDDLYDGMTTNQLTYTVQTMVSGQKVTSSTGSTNNTVMTTLNATTASQLNALVYNGQNWISGQSSSGTTTSAQDYGSAALQVAIWAFLYNGNSATASITSGSVFTLNTTGTVLTDAQAFLACIAGTAVTGFCSAGGWSANSGYTLNNVYLPNGESGSKKQSFLVLTANGNDTPGTPVPEPASMALLGMGLAGLAALRRRR